MYAVINQCSTNCCLANCSSTAFLFSFMLDEDVTWRLCCAVTLEENSLRRGAGHTEMQPCSSDPPFFRRLYKSGVTSKICMGTCIFTTIPISIQLKFFLSLLYVSIYTYCFAHWGKGWDAS